MITNRPNPAYLDQMADDIERICKERGNPQVVGGGVVYPSIIRFTTTGDIIDQALADELARHFEKRIPIYDLPQGNLIEVPR